MEARKIDYQLALLESQQAYRKAAVYETFIELNLDDVLNVPASAETVSKKLNLNCDALYRFLNAAANLKLVEKNSQELFQSIKNRPSYSKEASVILFWLFNRKISDILSDTPKSLMEIEKIIYIDNLNTCLQSLAKWHTHQQDFQKAEACLREICKLDPFDSVGYSEMGLLLNRLERFEEAKNYFENAVKLGPPGVGMNIYFQAKCLEKIGKTEEAVKLLKKASNIDKNAVSPLLDLFNYYRNINNIEMLKIAKSILASAILSEQLEPHELQNFQDVINQPLFGQPYG